MSKYDFEIDLSPNSSTGMILNKLRPGSVVLEFGCATGRMTRYMKEALGCQVYIVEYERSAFEKALQFAEDGICDDIQNYRWAERFAGISFDAVIFADVLEHLTQPEQALAKAASFLKNDGSIYVSVPNVTHNDIVLKMYEERFDYTQTGLLDDTHVHFWGLENVKQLGASAGLSVRSVEGTPCAAGNTEQNVQLGRNRLLENILRQRHAGETYQFVVTLDKSGAKEPECTVAPPHVYSHIYLDTGSDFNSEERIAVNSLWCGHDSYITHFEITDVKNLHKVRLDPVELQSVILRSVSVCQNGEELHVDLPNAVQTDSGLFLPGDDPMVIARVEPDGGAVTVDAEFLLPGTEYLKELEASVCAKQARMEALSVQHRDEICGMQNVLEQQKKAATNRESALNKNIATLQETILRDEEEKHRLSTDVSAYFALVNQKEKLSIMLEQDLETTQAHLQTTQENLQITQEQLQTTQENLRATQAHLRATQEQLQVTEQQRNEYAAFSAEQAILIIEQGKSLEYYRNLRVVRARAFVLRVLRKIKRCMKTILERIKG